MALSHSPRIATDGLVLCLDASDPQSYSGSGNTWSDRSGNGSNGTLTNGPTFDSDNKGSLVFDGVNDYINFGNPSSASNSQVTVTFWYNPTTIHNSTHNGIFNGQTSGGRFCLFWFSTDNVSVQYRDDSGLTAAQGGVWIRSTAPTAISTANKWYFIQITGDEDSDEWRVGVDLNPSTSDSSSQYVEPDATNWLLGKRSGTAYDHSKIANFQAYNRVLSQAEILQNFNAQKSKFGL